MASKILTSEQAQARKDAAVRFAENVLDDPDKASDIESEDLDDWVERKRITLIENTEKRSQNMPNGNGDRRTKADLLDEIEDLQSQLDAINDILNPPGGHVDDYDADDETDDDLGD